MPNAVLGLSTLIDYQVSTYVSMKVARPRPNKFHSRWTGHVVIDRSNKCAIYLYCHSFRWSGCDGNYIDRDLILSSLFNHGRLLIEWLTEKKWKLPYIIAVYYPEITHGFRLRFHIASWHCTSTVRMNIKTTHWYISIVSSNWCQGPTCYHGLALTPAWTSNYIHNKAWNEVTYTSPRFK